jgi:type II secretory pathway component PulF
MASAKKPAAGGIKRVRRSRKKSLEESASAPAAQEAAVAAPATSSAPSSSSFWTLSPTREQDVLDFLRQLIMLLEAGTPLLKSLKILGERMTRGGIRRVVNDIAVYVEAGNPLWQAMERHGHQFDSVDINLIKASEASGTLVTVMARIVKHKERKIMMRKRVRGAMIYPLVLIAACLGVVFVLARFVIPEFRSIFDKLGQQLPYYTELCFTIAGFLGNPVVWVIAIVALVVLYILYKFAMGVPATALVLDRIKLRIPIAGKIIRSVALVEMMRSLSLLLNSGLSMMVTLDLVRNVLSNKAFAHVIHGVRDSVERGEGIEAPMRREPGVVPPVVTDMLVTGEESGSIDKISEQLADNYEEDAAIRITALGEAIQPALTIFLGAIVLIVALCLFKPLIDMMETLNTQ